MRSIYDVDVILLLATMLASKRRPADLVGIVAAAELVQGLQGTLPTAAKLRAAFSRLATNGLVCAAVDGFALTTIAEGIVAGASRKATHAERLAGIREKLADYTPAGGHTDITVTDDAWNAAIAEHRASAAGAGTNQLVPKPKSDDNERKRAGKGPGKTPGKGPWKGPARNPGSRQQKSQPARRNKS